MQQGLKYLISALVLVIAGVVTRYVWRLPVYDQITFVILWFLVITIILQQFRLRNIENTLIGVSNLLSLVQKALGGVFDKLSQLSRSKGVMGRDLQDAFIPFSKYFRNVADAYLGSLKLGSPEEQEEIERLLREAERGTIKYEEAVKLRKLLEQDRKRREDANDILGAILVGALLLFIIGLLSKLLAEREED